MRQFEGAWYSQAAIDRSKIRLQRLGYFETVDVDNAPVAGTNDQVDVVFTVKETTSGSFVFGLGYSQLPGLTTSIQVSQNNFLGTGNRVSVEAQRNDYLQRYAFSFLNPYFTDEGMSLGYNLTWREFDNSNFNTASYSTHQPLGAGRRSGLPITENDTVSALFGIDSNQIFTFPARRRSRSSITSTPSANARSTPGAAQLAWARDTRNDYFTPTRGTFQRVSAEFTLPGSTVAVLQAQLPVLEVLAAVARAGAQHAPRTGLRRQLRQPDRPATSASPPAASRTPTTNPATPPRPAPGRAPSDLPTGTRRTTAGPITADGLPFFENFYAGGTNSVRGFRDNTLGPREVTRTAAARRRGEDRRLAGNVLPDPDQSPGGPTVGVRGLRQRLPQRRRFQRRHDCAIRRASRCCGARRSGPISISYAFPLSKQPGDEIERLQFTFGGQF